jgi:23S rRNA maturation mini-RNase III
MKYTVRIAELRIIRRVINARSQKEAQWAAIEHYRAQDRIAALVVRVDKTQRRRKK